MISVASWQNQQNDYVPSEDSDQPGHPLSLIRLCPQWLGKDPSFLHADREDTDQTGRMPRLIWVFNGRTDHFVCFVMRRLISCFHYKCIFSNPTHEMSLVTRKCAGWSAPLLFAMGKNRFSHDVAQMVYRQSTLDWTKPGKILLNKRFFIGLLYLL